MRHFLAFFLIPAVVAALLTAPAWAQEKIMRQDTNEDGKIDQIALFDKRGRIIKLEIDSNADEVMDRFQYYEKEQIIRVESDADLNGRIDTWEYYKNGQLARVERDEKGIGKISLKIFYRNDKKYRLIMDKDNDGRFEITEWFDRSPWSMVMEIDSDGDKNPEGRYCYKKNVLRLKEIDEDSDGSPDVREHYSAESKLVKSQERHEAVDHLDITWFYNGDEEAIRAEKDLTGDGRVDTWYHYHKGSLITVEEDTNADGKPDLWEEFDESEAIVKRSIDLNFDGKPDIEENAGEQVNNDMVGGR